MAAGVPAERDDEPDEAVRAPEVVDRGVDDAGRAERRGGRELEPAKAGGPS